MKMASKIRGFTLVEVIVGTAIFLLFSIGVYSALSLTFKTVYQSKMRLLETSLAVEELERIRNLPFSSVGTIGGVPAGVLSHTKVVNSNGVNLLVTLTIRSIDDPYDGTATSTPPDIYPEDRKIVEASVNCVACDQLKPVVLTSEVSPRGLESATLNGSLFVRVVSAVGLPVSGANVQITNSSSTPAVVISDVADNDGWLRVFDTPTGTLSYNISVTKLGFSSDYTVVPTAANPSPTKLPASVQSQAATTVNFSIDSVGNVALHTMNQLCSPLGSVPVWLRGQKQIGSLPLVYKYDKVITTNSAGDHTITNAEWDTYAVYVTGTAYDLVGTIPLSPFTLLPGASQDVSVVLKPHSANSLLVKVKDAGTGLPFSSSSVRLNSATYDQTLLTGLGYVQQTDWSGGGGQDMYINPQKYSSDDGNVDTQTSPGDVMLRKVGNYYLGAGSLESATFDLETPVNFSNITFNPALQATSTGSNPVLLQIAMSNTSTPATWNFKGPDGSASSFYTATSTVVFSGHNGSRYIRYRLYLSTQDTNITPKVSDVSIMYTTSCVAPGQSFFPGLTSGTYTLNVSHDGYATNNGQITIGGNTEIVVNLSPL